MYMRVAMAVAVAAFFFVMFVFPVKNYDIFWHMANGRAMVEEGRIVNEELFSFTAPGVEFDNKEWLSQVVFYLVYAAGGTVALNIFKACMLLGSFALIYRTSRMLGASVPIVLSLILLACIVGHYRFTVRPQIFSFLFLMTVQLLLYGSRSGRINPRWLFLFVFIYPIWEMFQGALWGVLFLGAYCTGEAVHVIYSRVRGRSAGLPEGYLKGLAQAVAAMLVVLAVSTHGLRDYLVYLNVVDDSSFMFKYTIEFKYTDFSRQPYALAMIVLTLGLCAVFARSIPLPYLFALIPFVAMAIRFVRATAVFAMVAVPVASIGLGELYREASKRSWSRKLCISLYTVVVVAMLALALDLKFNPKSDYIFSFSLNEEKHPAPAVRFIKEAGIYGNMYNRDRYGGFLAYHLFPGRRIYLYALPAAFDSVLKKSQDRAIFDEYDITWAVLSYNDSWDMMLFEPDKWVPVFWNARTAVALRRIPANSELIERYGLKLVLPGVSAETLRDNLRKHPQMIGQVLNEAARLIKYGRNNELAELAGELAIELRLPRDEGGRICSQSLLYNPGSASLHRCLEYYGAVAAR